MDQIVLYVCEDISDPGLKKAGTATVQTVFYKRDFVEAMIDQPGLVGAVVILNQSDEEWEELLRSVVRSFPLLPLLLITENSAESGTADPPTLKRTSLPATTEELQQSLTLFSEGTGTRDRREYHRYDFPLRARLHSEDEPVHEIRHISAGGAFLKPSGTVQTSGASCEIEIMFQNFSISTTCQILDSRETASNAEPGFGIRFTALSPAATSFINKTVQDALVQVLTNPEADPDIPTLDEDEDLLSIGDEFSLSI